MEKFVEQTLLYDFYGELLTERQQQVYESVVLEDYSLSEVAEDLGISRQGVHDMIKRCNHTLEEYESRLHPVSYTHLDVYKRQIVYDAVAAAKARNADVLICDTAGRLHNKKNLMEELRDVYKRQGNYSSFIYYILLQKIS